MKAPNLDKVNRTAELIRTAMLRKSDLGTPGRSEVKKWDLKQIESTNIFSLSVEVGLIGDEGTLASIDYRDYRYYTIHPGGGCVLIFGSNGYTLKYRKCSGRTAIWNPPYRSLKKEKSK